MSKASFTDIAGQVWHPVITIGALRRLREKGIDLLSEAVTEALGNDILKVITVVYELCKPQIESVKLTEEQFAERFNGDTLEDAAVAITEALANFFPRKAQTMLQEIEKAKAQALQQNLENQTQT